MDKCHHFSMTSIWKGRVGNTPSHKVYFLWKYQKVKPSNFQKDQRLHWVTEAGERLVVPEGFWMSDFRTSDLDSSTNISTATSRNTLLAAKTVLKRYLCYWSCEDSSMVALQSSLPWEISAVFCISSLLLEMHWNADTLINVLSPGDILNKHFISSR